MLRLEAVTTNGEIEALQSSLSDVQIAATIRAESEVRVQATKIVAQRRADQTLVVGVQWPDGEALPREGCDFQIQLPAVSGVMLRTDNGRLATSGLSGPASLQTSNGAIDVSGHHGAVTAATSNGQTKIAGATSSVSAQATNGAILVALAPDAPGPVELRTTTGLVDLAVGPGFAGRLTLTTTVGAISSDDSVGAKRVENGPHQVELEFGPGDKQSEVSSVVGAIHVRMVGE